MMFVLKSRRKTLFGVFQRIQTVTNRLDDRGGSDIPGTGERHCISAVAFMVAGADLLPSRALIPFCFE